MQKLSRSILSHVINVKKINKLLFQLRKKDFILILALLSLFELLLKFQEIFLCMWSDLSWVSCFNNLVNQFPVFSEVYYTCIMSCSYLIKTSSVLSRTTDLLKVRHSLLFSFNPLAHFLMNFFHQFQSFWGILNVQYIKWVITFLIMFILKMTKTWQSEYKNFKKSIFPQHNSSAKTLSIKNHS